MNDARRFFIPADVEPEMTPAVRAFVVVSRQALYSMSEPRMRLESLSLANALSRLPLGPLRLPVGSFGASLLQKGVRLRADRGYLQDLLRELPFQAIGIGNEKQLADYDKVAAELRSDELIRVAAGLPVPGLDSLKDLRFPELAQSSKA